MRIGIRSIGSFFGLGKNENGKARTKLLAFVASLLLLVAGASLYAVWDLGIVELDGNVASDAAVPGIDWADLYPNGGQGSEDYFFKNDIPDEHQFTIGS